jgi:hypothetical protein
LYRKRIRVEEKEALDDKLAIEEMQKEQEAQNHDDDGTHQKELDEEEKYQEMKLKCKRDFGIITQEEFDKILEDKKKAKNL